MKSNLFIPILVSVVVWTLETNAQGYQGTTGLLHVPSAETDSAGTFRGGAFFLHKEFTPSALQCDKEKFNTGCYFISLTPWRWIEASFCFTLLKIHKNKDVCEPTGYYNQDRRMSLKLCPLYEGKWWPSIAIGVDDFEQSIEKILKNRGGTYFHNYFITGSKHFNIRGYEIGAHLAYRYYPSNANRDRRGVAGGLTFRPAFYPPLRLIVEWDGIGVNAGADVLLWRHLFIQAALIHGRGFTGGIGYHYTIPF